MRIIKTKNYDEMSKAAANIIAAQITLKPDSVMGFATGSTPIGTYKCLVEKFEKGDLVRIIAEGQYIGIGKISCDSQAARRNMGKKGQRAFIHYDYLYLE